jgi:hypothetical protein
MSLVKQAHGYQFRDMTATAIVAIDTQQRAKNLHHELLNEGLPANHIDRMCASKCAVPT